MKPCVGDVILDSNSGRVRTVLKVDGDIITYAWRDTGNRPSLHSALGLLWDTNGDISACTYTDFYENRAYTITRNKQYLLDKYKEICRPKN